MADAKFTYIAAWIGVLVALGIDIGAIFNDMIAKATPFGKLLLFFVIIYLLSKVDWHK